MLDSDNSLAIMIGVGGSTGIRTPRISLRRRVDQLSRSTGTPARRCSTSTRSSSTCLEQPILRRALDLKARGGERIHRRLHVGFGHDHVDVMDWFRAPLAHRA